MIDQNTLYLGISLLILICVNIVLGSVDSFFQQQFDKAKFWKGLLKGLVVCVCFILILIVGQLNPNILMINVDGNEVTLSNATYLLMMSGYLFYGKEVLVKLSNFVKGKFEVDANKTEEDK